MSFGVLLKDDTGAWVVNTRVTPVSGLTVWAVVPGTAPVAPAPAAVPASVPATLTPLATATSLAPDPPPIPALPPATLVKIGSATNGRFTLDQAPLRTMPQGSIVILTRQ